MVRRLAFRTSVAREWKAPKRELELLDREHEKSVEEHRAFFGSWRELRNALALDRWELLKFFCAVTDYVPLPHLIDFHLSAPDDPGLISHKLMLGGIGGGKTHCAMAELEQCVIANPGGWFVATAPTFDQAIHVLKPHWDAFVDKFEKAGYPIQHRWDGQLQMASLTCGGRFFIRTYGKVGNLLGFEYTGVSMTEIDTVARPLQVWDALKGRVRKPGANYREIIGDTTPRGLAGVTALFDRNREEAKLVEDPEARERLLNQWYWTRALGRDNPHLPADYLPSLRASYSQRQWRQEVEAEILQPESAVWPEFSKDTHEQRWTFDPSLPWNLTYDAGDQFPHVLWVQHTPHFDVVFDELCPDQWPIDKLHTEILARSNRLKRPPEFAVGDRAVKSELSWLMDAFPKTTVRRMHTRHEQSVNEGIELVRARLDPLDGPPRLVFAPHLFVNPPRRGIVRCMAAYRYKVRSDGGLTNEPWKDNVHDHGADAARMLMVALYGTEFQAFNVSRYH